MSNYDAMGSGTGAAANCTAGELSQKLRFEEAYSRSQSPIMRAIEGEVCGCDYGGNSWTTREQADDLIARLHLSAGVCLLDLGAGSGWPGLYLSQVSGCNVVLVDLPETGLRIADERAEEEGISSRVSTLMSDAATLPLPSECFDAINHSDLLCCLVRKRAVLKECRRVLRLSGTMAFTVISIQAGLSEEDYARAAANGPDFIETDRGYVSLLEDTGWLIVDRQDLTRAYRDACSRQIQADTAHSKDLANLLGQQELSARLTRWCEKFAAIEDGLFRRELFVAVPDRNPRDEPV